MNQEEKTRVLATKLMGWEIFGYDDAYQRSLNGQEVLAFYGLKDDVWMTHKDAAPTPWDPYESIADSFMVLEKFQARLWYVQIELEPDSATVWMQDMPGGGLRYEATCQTISEAICDAALEAITAISPPPI